MPVPLRILIGALLLPVSLACKKEGDAATDTRPPVEDGAGPGEARLPPANLDECERKTTETDPPEEVYSCEKLIAVHVVVPDALPTDEVAAGALDRLVSGLQTGGTLQVTGEREAIIPVGGKSLPGTALLIHSAEKGDSVAGYTWAERDGASHLLFCMAPGQLFFEGRCDPVWDQMLAAQ